MKPLDQFKRTPLRRYDKAPPPPPEEKRTLEPAIRKRYFGVPSFECMHAGRWLGGAICAAMLLTLCNASAPMGDVPTVQQRFTQWAAIQNEKTVQRLPRSDAGAGQRFGRGGQFQPGSGEAGSEAGGQTGNPDCPGRNPAGNDADADHGGYVHGL